MGSLSLAGTPPTIMDSHFSNPGPPSHLEALPNELIIIIADYLDPQTLPAFRCTSRILSACAVNAFGSAFITERRHVLSLQSLEKLVHITAHPLFGRFVKSVRLGVVQLTEHDCRYCYFSRPEHDVYRSRREGQQAPIISDRAEGLLRDAFANCQSPLILGVWDNVVASNDPSLSSSIDSWFKVPISLDTVLIPSCSFSLLIDAAISQGCSVKGLDITTQNAIYYNVRNLLLAVGQAADHVFSSITSLNIDFHDSHLFASDFPRMKDLDLFAFTARSHASHIAEPVNYLWHDGFEQLSKNALQRSNNSSLSPTIHEDIQILHQSSEMLKRNPEDINQDTMTVVKTQLSLHPRACLPHLHHVMLLRKLDVRFQIDSSCDRIRVDVLYLSRTRHIQTFPYLAFWPNPPVAA